MVRWASLGAAVAAWACGGQRPPETPAIQATAPAPTATEGGGETPALPAGDAAPVAKEDAPKPAAGEGATAASAAVPASRRSNSPARGTVAKGVEVARTDSARALAMFEQA